MRTMLRLAWWLAVLALNLPLLAGDKPATVFTLSLEGVSFDYPGAEYWAEIAKPDGSHAWAFATYIGQQNWTVPVPAGPAGRYELLRVESRRPEKQVEVRFAKTSRVAVDRAAAAVETNPPKAPAQPLVDAGEFTTIFAAEEPWCVNDHTFVQAPDKTWHLFGITHPKPLDFMKDPGRRLAHATARSLLQTQWQALPPAVTADWDRHREYLLWAPHVLRHDGIYYMFVCVGDKDSHRYRIHLLTSPDLKEWTRHPENPMVIDGFDGRDPMVLRVDGQWVMYYVANSTPECGNHLVACVTSRDLVHWSGRRVALLHPRAGTFGGPTESPFVVRRGGNYYLFVCDNEWTDVYVSNDPFHWDYERKAGRILAHAAEIVRDTDGRWFISHTGWMAGPVRLAPLHWRDGLDTAPTSLPPAEK